MLYRKIETVIEEHLKSDSKKILLIDGARQVGKTYIIRYVGKKIFKNFIEINMVEDSLGNRLFENTKTVEDFYLQVSMLAGNKMGKKSDTLIFIDEIQAYPHLLTLLKFLSQDGKFTFIASGSLLGVTLSQTTSIPMGSIRKVRMFPLDFEEFLYANGMNEIIISAMQKKFENLESLDESMHNRMMDLFRKYLLVGGFPMRLTAIFLREIFSPSERYKAKFTNIMLQTLQNTMMKTNLKSAEFMTSFRQIWKTKRKGLLQKILRIKAVSVSATIRMNSSI